MGCSEDENEMNHEFDIGEPGIDMGEFRNIIDIEIIDSILFVLEPDRLQRFNINNNHAFIDWFGFTNSGVIPPEADYFDSDTIETSARWTMEAISVHVDTLILSYHDADYNLFTRFYDDSIYSDITLHFDNIPAIDEFGNEYLCGGSEFFKYDVELDTILSFGEYGIDEGELLGCSDILSQDSILYIRSYSGNTIELFNYAGEFIDRWTNMNSSESTDFKLYGNNIFFIDRHDIKLHKVNLDGIIDSYVFPAIGFVPYWFTIKDNFIYIKDWQYGDIKIFSF